MHGISKARKKLDEEKILGIEERIITKLKPTPQKAKKERVFSASMANSPMGSLTNKAVKDFVRSRLTKIIDDQGMSSQPKLEVEEEKKKLSNAIRVLKDGLYKGF